MPLVILYYIRVINSDLLVFMYFSISSMFEIYKYINMRNTNIWTIFGAKREKVTEGCRKTENMHITMCIIRPILLGCTNSRV